MNTLYIEVTAFCGSDVGDACADLVRLADRMGITVRCKMNGVQCIVSPGDRDYVLYKNYRRALRKESGIIAVGHER